MNQPYKRLWEGCGTASGPPFLRRLRAAYNDAMARFGSACGGGGKPVAYSILFQ
jgi:hypothetical protein